MTTHSMEEADILGDNIAIMTNGQLRWLSGSTKICTGLLYVRVLWLIIID